jgi:hypothetical protein
VIPISTNRVEEAVTFSQQVTASYSKRRREEGGRRREEGGGMNRNFGYI